MFSCVLALGWWLLAFIRHVSIRLLCFFHVHSEGIQGVQEELDEPRETVLIHYVNLL